jgi:hypothetical protein
MVVYRNKIKIFKKLRTFYSAWFYYCFTTIFIRVIPWFKGGVYISIKGMFLKNRCLWILVKVEVKEELVSVMANLVCKR